jgi:hypothetical protein
LVVQEIRRHPNQRQIADPLPDDFVSGGERDEMSEALERDPITRPDDLANSVGERHHDGHAREA